MDNLCGKQNKLSSKRHNKTKEIKNNKLKALNETLVINLEYSQGVIPNSVVLNCSKVKPN